MEVINEAMSMYLFGALIFVIAGLLIAYFNIFSKEIDYSKNYIFMRFLKMLPYVLFYLASYLAYRDAGNSVEISLFNGIGSFFRVTLDCSTSVYTKILNTFATILLINALVPSLRNFIKLCIYFIKEKTGDKTIYVLHGNNDTTKIIRHNFESKNKHIIEVDIKNEKFYHHFNNHIIAYDSEDKNMKMAVLINNINNKATLYVLSSSCDSTLFMRNSINIIDKNDLAVKQFWKSYGGEIYNKLKEKSFKNCRISIVGTNDIAYIMYLHVLKNCIYRLDQSININVLTNFFNMEYFKLANETIKDKMTNDTVTIDLIKHSNVYNMQESDIVIVTDKSLLSKVAIKYRYGQLLYLYDQSFNKNDYENSNQSEEENNIKPFGADSVILSVENIINNKDTKLAKLVHYGYGMSDEEKEKLNKDKNYSIPQNKLDEAWKSINKNVIYNVNSNYSVADHWQFRKYVIEDIKDEMTLALLEHIHWCRVIYLEGFRYYKEYQLDNELLADIDKFVINEEGTKDEKNETKKKMINTKIHYDLIAFDPIKDAKELEKDTNIYSLINIVHSKKSK